jgi:hypothetical protein
MILTAMMVRKDTMAVVGLVAVVVVVAVVMAVVAVAADRMRVVAVGRREGQPYGAFQPQQLARICSSPHRQHSSSGSVGMPQETHPSWF